MQGNIILDLLPLEVFERLYPFFEKVQLPANQNIFNDGDYLEHVYFPLGCVFYLFSVMENGSTVESGVIGNEGVVGLPAFFGAKTFFHHAKILASSTAIRIKTSIIKDEFDKGGILQQLILRYAHAFFVQISQTAACNRMHQIEVRVCRWLLLMRDKTGSDTLMITQEFIACMLGAQRPYVTVAIGALQKREIIRCARGQIEILDSQALEQHSCECYPIIQKESNYLAFSIQNYKLKKELKIKIFKPAVI